MLEIACKSTKEPNLEVSDIELKTEKSFYAIDAFKLIQSKYKKHENYYIMGADNFINILKWKRSEELITNYKYIILEREDIDLEAYIEKNKKINRKNITVIKNKEHRNISSTDFRSKNKREEIIPEEVLEYIKEKQLYK